MKKIEVCLTPEIIHLHDIKGKVVVIVDILRASTTITAALANGIRSIRPFASVEGCRQMKNNGYIVAGERGGKIIEGFDLGNSPTAFFDEQYFGEKLALTTTNGTKCIELSRPASKIIIGSLTNLNAVADYLKTEGKDVLILCAGWRGRVNAEDTLFAGALALQLQNDFESETDAALVAKAVYTGAKGNMKEYLKNAEHLNRLKNLGIQEDVEFSLSLNKFNIVPELEGEDIIVKN